MDTIRLIGAGEWVELEILVGRMARVCRGSAYAAGELVARPATVPWQEAARRVPTGRTRVTPADLERLYAPQFVADWPGRPETAHDAPERAALEAIEPTSAEIPGRLRFIDDEDARSAA